MTGRKSGYLNNIKRLSENFNTLSKSEKKELLSNIKTYEFLRKIPMNERFNPKNIPIRTKHEDKSESQKSEPQITTERARNCIGWENMNMRYLQKIAKKHPKAYHIGMTKQELAVKLCSFGENPYKLLQSRCITEKWNTACNGNKKILETYAETN